MRKLEILLADDDAGVRELVTDGVLARGHSITVCQDGNELLKLVENGPGVFDVIVTDNNMPGGPPGLEILAFLKNHRKGFEEIPIILHSRTDDEETLQELAKRLDGVFCPKKSDNRCLFIQLDELAKD